MKKLLIVCLTIVLVGSVTAGDSPIVTMTFKVKDDFDAPVAGVVIRLVTFVRWEPGEASGKDIYDGLTGKTDAAGLLTLSVPCSRGKVQYSARLDGYYSMEGADYRFRAGKAGTWEPSHPNIDIPMKAILNPTAVVARRLTGVRIPERGKPIGFDLVKSDWVLPYGRGEVSDFVLTLSGDLPTPGAQSQSTLRLQFSNEGDGIQSVIVPMRGVSRLRLPRFAPETGYVSELVLGRERPASDDESQNYFFRVRTQLVDGKAKRALYGKIGGSIEFWENGEIRFAYQLNPDPLSRNMEFDMKRNELGGLRGYEVINEP